MAYRSKVETYSDHFNVFWREKYESLRTEYVRVSRDECFLMTKNKQCNGFPMDCQNEYFTFQSNPVPIFKWMSERTNESFSCTTSPKLITGNSPNDYLFNGKCKVSDRECHLHDSIIVWDAIIYHECPLYKISQETFTLQQNNDVIITNNNLAFQAIDSKEMCGLKVLSTLEGVYVSIKVNDLITNNRDNTTNIDEMKELLMAESDYKTVKDIEDKNELLLRECLDFKHILYLFSRLEDRYLTHYLSDGSKITLYTTMGTVQKVNYQPIRYIEDNTTRTGFLSQDGIIKSISDLIPCNKVIEYIQLPNVDKTIVRQRHQSFVASESQLNYFNIDYLSNKIKEPQLSHNSLLLDGIDLLSIFQEVVNHEMSAGTWCTHMSDTSNIRSKLVDTKVPIENTIYMWINYGFYFFIEISTFFLLLVTDNVKWQIVGLLKGGGKTQQEIAELVGVSQKFVSSIKKKHESTGQLSDLRRSGRARKLNFRDESFIFREIRKNPTLSYKNLAVDSMLSSQMLR
ncbi:unnamed protein product [Brachionus calyciflorus]|uniref:Uncharacterized protein n=1 Tax=Brachionus calyciflorus TaxID=104777 RepID=A0A814M5K7_9BILA|nr:unnamed protein product [Brachionus calyciflorus]